MTDLVRRAEAAQRILDDPTMQEVFDALDAEYVRIWRRAIDLGERERAHAGQAALAAIRKQVQIFADEREIAERL